MLSYSSKPRPILQVLQKGSNTKENISGCNTPEPKRTAFRPPILELNKKTYTPYNNQYTTTLTPNTAAKTNRNTYHANTPISATYTNRLSPNVTPDKTRKRDASFLIAEKSNMKEITTEKEDYGGSKRVELRNVQNERSRKACKTVYFQNVNVNEIIKAEEEMAKLRQTVNSASSWLAKNNMPPKSIKTHLEFQGDTNKDQNISMRKKIESEYLPSPKPQPQPQQLYEDNSSNNLTLTIANSSTASSSKFVPTRSHLRNKTTFQDNSNTTNSTNNVNQVADLTLKFKHSQPQQQSQATTPRISQQKMAKSINLKVSNPMNKTDPSGTAYQRAATQRHSITTTTPNTTFNVTPNKQSISLDDFQLGPCKGEGRFGKVFPALHKKTGFLLAIKQVKKQSVRLMLDQFIQQIKISLFLSHSYVVKFYGFFSDTLHFYILMEYMEEGSLYKLIKASKKLPEKEVVGKLAEVCQAVNYLHSLDVLHRDIKPENIVLSNGVCKLCDFGWAAYSKERRTTYCGTLDYVCPEILQGQSYDSFVDIWAVGVLAFEMLTGKAPFYHISREQTMKSIKQCDFGFPEEMSAAARSFIAKSLQKTPDKRVTIEQLLRQKFLYDALRALE